MRIGVDIDDTISCTSKRMIEEALIYDEECLNGRGFKDKNGTTFMEKFYWNVYNVDEFLDRLGKSNFLLNLDVVEDANKYVSKLYNEGHEIILITRRQNSLRVKMKTKKWLKNKGFKYHKLVLGMKEKGKYCKDNKIELLIDNDYKNYEDATNLGVDALLISDKHNKDLEGYKRADSWKEIYEYVNGVK